MDRLAGALGMDPWSCGSLNALPEGGELPTGQAVRGPVAVPEMLERLVSLPCPARPGPPLAARRRVPGRRRRRRGAGGRLRGRVQEHRVLRGLRRPGDRARFGWSGGTGGSRRPSTPPPRRSDRACSACRSRSRARSWASPTCSVLPADTRIAIGGLCVRVAPDVDRRRRGPGGVPRASPGRSTPSRRAGSWRPSAPTATRGRTRWIRSPARATPTPASRSSRTGPSSTSTPSSGWRGSSSWPARRTSGSASTRSRSRASSQGGAIQGLGLALTEELVDGGRRRARPQLRRATASRRSWTPPPSRRSCWSSAPGRALRAARGGGDAVDLLDPGGAGGAARGDGPGADSRARSARGP